MVKIAACDAPDSAFIDIVESNNVSKELWINFEPPVNWTLAFSLSDLKLYKFDNPVSWLLNTFQTFKPKTFDCPFISVVWFNVVKPLTFNDDDNVVFFLT